jgi:hypothetical protein
LPKLSIRIRVCLQAYRKMPYIQSRLQALLRISVFRQTVHPLQEIKSNRQDFSVVCLRWDRRLHRGHDRFEMGQSFFDGEAVHFPAKPFTRFQRGLQIVAGDLNREGICD